jgi:cell division protein ZapA
MSSPARPTRVHILDKEYLIACPEDERESLFASAEYLTEKMREIRDTGKIVGIDRIAVIAALNIAHELLEMRNGRDDFQSNISDRLRSLQQKIDSAINQGRQMEL